MKRYRVSFLLVASVVSIAFFASICNGFTGKITEVREGDFYIVSAGEKTLKVRLYGVMCPVRGQLFYDSAVLIAKFLAVQKKVEITPVYTVGDIIHALVRIDGVKSFLNEQLIGYGLAWVKPDSCKARFCEEWKKLEGVARQNSIGLWADPSPIPPWEWEKKQKPPEERKAVEAGGAK